jgi:sporulation protein YabP
MYLLRLYHGKRDFTMFPFLKQKIRRIFHLQAHIYESKTQRRQHTMPANPHRPATAEPEINKKRSASRHSLQVDRREKVTVTGLIDVISFDEESVIGETEMGIMIIKGGNLHVSRINLDAGELAVSGDIDAITYENPGGGAKAKTLLGRMFR